MNASSPHLHRKTTLALADGTSRRMTPDELHAFWTAMEDADWDAVDEDRLDQVFSRRHDPEVEAQVIAFCQENLATDW